MSKDLKTDKTLRFWRHYQFPFSG